MQEVYDVVYGDFLKEIFDDKTELSTAEFKKVMEKKEDWMNAKSIRDRLDTKKKALKKEGLYIDGKNGFENAMGNTGTWFEEVGDGAKNLVTPAEKKDETAGKTTTAPTNAGTTQQPTTKAPETDKTKPATGTNATGAAE